MQELSDNSIVGLTETANKSYHYPKYPLSHPKNATDRTFLGISDKNADGYHETILIFNSELATQPAAADVLYDFGADKVVMLDGGSSSQLICNGKSLISSSRTLPQTIGVIAGSPNNTAWTTGSYRNNEDRRQTLSIPSATSLTVTVSGNTERGYDYLYIYDENNTEIKKLHGSINETFTVSGSEITARLVTDYSVTKSGVTVSIVSGGEINQNDQDIEYFYKEYPSYFGAKSGGNYSCFSAYTCQNFSNGKKIAVHDQKKSLYWYDGSWHLWRNN
ncbi:MAG: hypothetical protein D3920_11340 [Candidatus Electrothrix sp. AW2]|nr:hypothetical protein [Candidatus Electrothrix gigas]